MSIEIGKKYFIDGETVEALAYNENKEALLVKEIDGNLVFVLGKFIIKDDDIVCHNRMGFAVNDVEMIDCIDSYFSDNGDTVITKEKVVDAIRNTYYKIPTYLAELIADWYMA